MIDQKENLSASERRPPIVVVLGHIDHGKTTLLDYIRKSTVAQKESGGITQHIGAYEVTVIPHAVRAFGSETQARRDDSVEHRITFIDTPGHEAFSKMRSRGATVADIAVLVVAADDGVKPQTKEALSAIQEAKIPYVVAINKIDKPNADPERAKNELAGEEVFLEGRGGTVPSVLISAKEGTGVDQLLETILLLADLETLEANSEDTASGVVIESHVDSRRGTTSTLLVRNGTLKKGEYVVAGEAISKIRILEDFRGKPIESAGPSSPVVVVGFDKIPHVGFEFKTRMSQKEAEAEVEKNKKSADQKKNQPTASQQNTDMPGDISENRSPASILGLIIKSDTAGSVEAIEHEIEKIKGEGFIIKFLRKDAGDVLEDDVKLASSGKAGLIIAFRVGIKSGVIDLAERNGVEIKKFDIIYEITDFLKEKIESILPPIRTKEIIGKVKILKIFGGEAKNQIIGGRVLEGILKKGARFSIVRRSTVIGEGKIENVQSGRVTVSEIEKNKEFGALTNSSINIAEGDGLEVFVEQETRRKL